MNKYWGLYTTLGDSFLENLQGMTTLKIYQADEAKQIATGAAKDVIKKVTEGAANNVMDEYVATPENAGMPNAVKRESRDNLILSY